MIKYFTFFIVLFSPTVFSQVEDKALDSIVENAFKTPFEKSEGVVTATYEQTILYYENLADAHPEIKVKKIGKTDAGLPLHLVIFDTDQVFNLNDKTKGTILINNGIHPGEPDGIDASMMLLRDIVESKQLKYKFKDLFICIIPIYNVGGSLNINSTSRVNQNGPFTYGFRGNALNYDLNRDFIKNDSKNAKAFTEIFQMTNPEIFVETHVSNSTDYQYTPTLQFTQHNKLGKKLGDFLYHKMIPDIEKRLENKKLIISPFINAFNLVPKEGFSQLLDSPRYSTGYASLFNTIGLRIETQMLRPYKERVENTYEMLLTILEFGNNYGTSLSDLREEEAKGVYSKNEYPIHWEVDSLNHKIFDFKGYESEIIKSEITGLDRLKFDRNRPFTKKIKYYTNYKPSKEIIIPKYYLISKNQEKVLERLKLNKIVMFPLKKNVAMMVESYIIADYKTTKSPFEGHYLHYDTTVNKTFRNQNFEAGDFLIPTNQPRIKYLLETLEPEATDSFFNWNFFDSILQQKENFSPYVFEDLAIELLDENKDLKLLFETKKKTDTIFSKDSYAQLDFIYQNSKYAEKSYMQYPIYRVLK
ncbi:MAG: hypothetical protein KAH07_04010 [Flavobacteriaceae bacterium]|nr:hypothetical protein [Flavobacteriaceae bacterium]